MLAFTLGVLAVIGARFGLDMLPGPRPLRLRDFGPGFAELAGAALVAGMAAIALRVVESRAPDGRAGDLWHGARLFAAGATIASVLTVGFWIFGGAVAMLCDRPDC